jgi:hypothetical protein
MKRRSPCSAPLRRLKSAVPRTDALWCRCSQRQAALLSGCCRTGRSPAAHATQAQSGLPRSDAVHKSSHGAPTHGQTSLPMAPGLGGPPGLVEPLGPRKPSGPRGPPGLVEPLGPRKPSSPRVPPGFGETLGFRQAPDLGAAPPFAVRTTQTTCQWWRTPPRRRLRPSSCPPGTRVVNTRSWKSFGDYNRSRSHPTRPEQSFLSGAANYITMAAGARSGSCPLHRDPIKCHGGSEAKRAAAGARGGAKTAVGCTTGRRWRTRSGLSPPASGRYGVDSPGPGGRR